MHDGARLHLQGLRSAPLIALSLLVAAVSACAPVVIGSGNPDRLTADQDYCRTSGPWYGWIPDPLGVLPYVAEGVCMRERGWVRAHGHVMGWTWVGPEIK